MADAFQTAAAWLETKRRAHLVAAVRYERGTQAVEISATIGRTEFEVPDVEGALVRLESRDYIVAAVDLDFGAGPVTPEPGDRVIETLADGSEAVHEVMGEADLQGWRWADPYRLAIRVHTKAVES